MPRGCDTFSWQCFVFGVWQLSWLFSSPLFLLNSMTATSCYQPLLYKIDIYFSQYAMWADLEIWQRSMKCTKNDRLYQFWCQFPCWKCSVHIKGNGFTQKWLTETGFCYCNLSTAEHSINRLVRNNYSAAIMC